MKKLIATSVLIWGLLFTSLPCNAQFLKKLGKAFEDAGKEMLQSAKSQQTASVKFSNLRLTYDQIDAKNGRKMLQVHYTLRVDGLQGHTLVPVLAIEIPQGTFHKFADGNDMKAEGNQLTCNYQSTTFNGQWQAIYIDAFNPLPGKRTYYARIYLVDMTLRKQIAESDYITFTNTGEQQSAQQSKPQQQVQQQQKSSSNHMTFQGIRMGQSGASIKAALKQKGFKAGEYDMSGTLNGVPVTVWVAEDGSMIRVTMQNSYTKVTARHRYEVLKSSLIKEYNGKVIEGGMEVYFGEGVVIATDRGSIELMYHNDDEMGEGNSINYTVTYLLKDGKQ